MFKEDDTRYKVACYAARATLSALNDMFTNARNVMDWARAPQPPCVPALRPSPIPTWRRRRRAPAAGELRDHHRCERQVRPVAHAAGAARGAAVPQEDERAGSHRAADVRHPGGEREQAGDEDEAAHGVSAQLHPLARQLAHDADSDRLPRSWCEDDAVRVACLALPTQCVLNAASLRPARVGQASRSPACTTRSGRMRAPCRRWGAFCARRHAAPPFRRAQPCA